MKPNKESTTHLYIQIRENIKEAINSGKYAPEEKLPPVIKLAALMEVTPATVRRALKDLTEDGLIYSHVGRGTFVATEQSSTSQNTTQHNNPQKHTEIHTSLHNSYVNLVTLSQRPGVIAFTRGIGDPETIEKGILTRLTTQALESGEEIFWDHGDPRGLLGLREEIARLYQEQNLQIHPDQILVTSGSQQAIALIAQQASESSTQVICETPCYSGVTNALKAFNTETHTIHRGKYGPNPEDFSGDPKKTILYLCPIIHNPTGTNIGEKERTAICTWAKKNEATILSDEVFRDLHFTEEDENGEQIEKPPLSFLADPGSEHAIILGSLSKSFISGLRVGWVVSSKERIQKLSEIKKAMDLGCPPLMQGIAREFLADQEGYRTHREKIRIHYKELRDVTLSALAKFMPKETSWSIPRGGFQLQVQLPEGYSSIELYMRSLENGAAFLPGPLQDMHNGYLNTFRLCYGSMSSCDIEEGIKRIASSTSKYLSESKTSKKHPLFGDF